MCVCKKDRLCDGNILSENIEQGILIHRLNRFSTHSNESDKHTKEPSSVVYTHICVYLLIHTLNRFSTQKGLQTHKRAL